MGKAKPKKRARPTIEVPDGEGWTRTVEIPLEEKAIPNANLNKSSWQRWKRDVIALLGFQPKADGVTDEQHLFSELGVNREKAVKSFNNGFPPKDFVDANQHYIAVVEKSDDEPPRRYTQNVMDMNAYMLKHELGQLKIDFECGPGPTVRQRLEAREKDIHRELSRRNALVDEVYEREERRRDKNKRPTKLIADAVVEVKLGTEHVRTKLAWFAEQCLVGPESQFKSVDELVYKLQEQVEQWVEIIEDQ